ncbi:MAG: hypothetical protein P8188_03985 [Gemmatimonadota bacterium]
MLEIIAAGALGAAGHLKSKDFVRRRLRYTNWVERPGIGLFTGAATAIVAGVAVAALPFSGAGAGAAVGIGMGLGVGTGVSRGARDAREGWHPDD